MAATPAASAASSSSPSLVPSFQEKNRGGKLQSVKYANVASAMSAVVTTALPSASSSPSPSSYPSSLSSSSSASSSSSVSTFTKKYRGSKLVRTKTSDFNSAVQASSSEANYSATAIKSNTACTVVPDISGATKISRSAMEAPRYGAALNGELLHPTMEAPRYGAALKYGAVISNTAYTVVPVISGATKISRSAMETPGYGVALTSRAIFIDNDRKFDISPSPFQETQDFQDEQEQEQEQDQEQDKFHDCFEEDQLGTRDEFLHGKNKFLMELDEDEQQAASSFIAAAQAAAQAAQAASFLSTTAQAASPATSPAAAQAAAQAAQAASFLSTAAQAASPTSFSQQQVLLTPPVIAPPRSKLKVRDKAFSKIFTATSSNKTERRNIAHLFVRIFHLFCLARFSFLEKSSSNCFQHFYRIRQWEASTGQYSQAPIFT